jgi:hypothetical protein
MKSRIVFVFGVVTGLGCAAVMRDNTLHAQAAVARGPVVRVDESKTAVTYANAYRIHMTPNEIVFDLGFSMPNPNAVQPGSEELLFTVSNRVVMTSSNAKKFQAALASAVKRFEDRYGEIPPPREDAPAKP